MPQFAIKLYAIGRMDPVSVNDADNFNKFYFFADLPLRSLTTEDTISRSTILAGMSSITIVKYACFFLASVEVSFVLLAHFLACGGFGATNSLMVRFLEILFAGGRSSTSKVLFLGSIAVSGVSTGGVSVEAV